MILLIVRHKESKGGAWRRVKEAGAEPSCPDGPERSPRRVLENTGYPRLRATTGRAVETLLKFRHFTHKNHVGRGWVIRNGERAPRAYPVSEYWCCAARITVHLKHGVHATCKGWATVAAGSVVGGSGHRGARVRIALLRISQGRQGARSSKKKEKEEDGPGQASSARGPPASPRSRTCCRARRPGLREWATTCGNPGAK